MKVSLLVRFGGLSLVLAQLLLASMEGAYYLSGRPTYPSAMITWVTILGVVIRVFGFMAVFAILAQRGNVFGLGGFILLVIGNFFSVSKLVTILGVAEGVITGEQLGLVSSYVAIQRYQPWFSVAGQFLFGIAIYQSKVDLKIMGLLIALLGILTYLSGPLAFLRPIYPVLSFVAWGWLGWELFTGKDRTRTEPVT